MNAKVCLLLAAVACVTAMEPSKTVKKRGILSQVDGGSSGVGGYAYSTGHGVSNRGFGGNGLGKAMSFSNQELRSYGGHSGYGGYGLGEATSFSNQKLQSYGGNGNSGGYGGIGLGKTTSFSNQKLQSHGGYGGNGGYGLGQASSFSNQNLRSYGGYGGNGGYGNYGGQGKLW